MKRVKILMICPQFKPTIGGYEIAAERLSRALLLEGHEVVVLTEKRNKEWIRYENDNGLSIIRLPIINKRYFHQVSAIFTLVIYLIRNIKKFDIVHNHQYCRSAIVSLIIGTLYRIPVILKITGTGQLGIKSYITKGFLCKFKKAIFNKFDGIIVTSKNAQREVIEVGFELDKIHFIPNGINLDNWVGLDTSKMKLSKNNGEIFVLFVGRFDFPKNPEGLIDAWKKLCNDLDNCVLLMIGHGPLFESIQTKVDQLQLTKKVKLFGFINDPSPFYKTSDIFILPSLTEGLSNSLIEAMFCGLPIVSTPVSGSVDIFSEAEVGILVKNNTPDELYKALKRLIVNKDLRSELGRNAQEYAAKNFSMSNVVRATVNLYMSLQKHS